MIVNLLLLQDTPIFEQLQIEEALIRSNSGNWCLLNIGSCPAIVMGISGKPNELIDLNYLRQNPIPVIRRFSGGGTVVVDENTLFATCIFDKAAHPFEAFPEPISRWCGALFSEAIGHPDFALHQNDFVLGNRKCGGNAQYLRKDRWLHHTTFLYSYRNEMMHYLLNPKKAPEYRKGRDHSEFLTPLKPILSSKEAFVQNIVAVLEKNYTVVKHEKESLNLSQEGRKTVAMIPL